MKRAVLVLTLLAGVLTAGASARAAERLTLTPLHGEKFPTKAFVLTMPPGVIPQPGQVHVSENGLAVNGLSVVPAAQDVQRRLGELLVIDSSASMGGKPIAAAMAAARAFASRRLPNQPLAVLTFNSASTTLLPFTTDASKINAALATTPPVGGGTHIYDTVETAIEMVRAQHLAGASIVLLSDGADVGSAVGNPKVLADANPFHVRIYSVGLHSAHFRPGTLSGLSSGTGGIYTGAASTKQLTGIFKALGSRLSNEYVVRYRSLVGPLTHVAVLASVQNVAATARADYLTPSLALSGGSLGAHRTIASLGAVIVVSVLIAALLAIALALLLRTRTKTLRERVEPYVAQLALPAPSEEPEEQATDAAEDSVVAKRLSGRRWWEEFCLAVEVARLRRTPVEIASLTVILTTVLFILLVAVTGHPILGFLAFATPVAVLQFVRWRARKQHLAFAEQLADNLQIVASALRAGHGFVGALGQVVGDAPEPSRAEFRRVLAEEQLGTPIEDALNIAVVRMENTDLNQVALVASTQRETGGNAAEVLDRVVESVRERMVLRRLIKTLTAQGRLSGVVVSALPVVLLLVIQVINPDFTRPLYTTTGGNIVLLIAGCMVVGGWLWIRRIINFDV